MAKNKKLQLHVLIEKEGELFSAICLELNVASQGKNIREAKTNLREAVELYLKDVYEAGDEQEFIPRPASIEEMSSINYRSKHLIFPQFWAVSSIGRAADS